jgi:hypothetical protein
MDANCKEIFKIIGIDIDINNLEDFELEREILLDDNKYKMIKAKIVEFKQIASSDNLTCLHENAQNKQKWPLLNLVRQILKHYKYIMKPIRKCDGYTLDGIKQFKRYFLIRKQ